jgi:hypothetical protein
MAQEFSFEADDKKVEQVLFSQRKFRVPDINGHTHGQLSRCLNSGLT